MVYPPHWLKIFNGISTTNLRIYFTLFLTVGTAIHYWSTDLAPDLGWLGFMLALAGIDAVQFATKRSTHKPEGAPKPGDVETDVESTASTDIQELSENSTVG